MPPRNFEIHFLWRIMPPQGRVPLVLGFRRVPPVWSPCEPYGEPHLGDSGLLSVLASARKAGWLQVL